MEGDGETRHYPLDEPYPIGPWPNRAEPRMDDRQTVCDLIQLLAKYHQSRHDIYRRLSSAAQDERAATLLEQLVDLEARTMKIIHDELRTMDPALATYLSNTPPVELDPLPETACRFESGPDFEEALECVWQADSALPEVLDRLENASSAESVQQLANRLRELEETKERQIAKFTRLD